MVKKKLLIVVDFQNDFVDGSLGFLGASSIEDFIVSKIKEFEDNGYDVVFTKDVHDNDYLDHEEGKHLPIKHCIKGSKGAELYGKVASLSKNHLIIEKDTFGAKGLFDYLKDKKYKEIYLVGLVSYICVISNAVIAKTANPDAHIVVLKKGTLGPDLKAHDAAFETMKNLHIEVSNF